MTIYKKHVFVCVSGKTCPKHGSEEVFHALRHEMKERDLHKSIRINKSGCLDQCDDGPIVVVYPEGTWYCGVKESDCKEIAEAHLVGNKKIERLLYTVKKESSCKDS
jgi:(2Fe-2S) ferredoxin